MIFAGLNKICPQNVAQRALRYFSLALGIDTAACIGPLRVLRGGNKRSETGHNAGVKLRLNHRGGAMRMRGVS